jgi:hypothetical protein
VNIADITTIPDGTKFIISTMTGTQRNVTLQLPTGKFCVVNFVQRNSIYVGRAETASFMKKGDYLHIINWDGDHRRVGEIVYSGGGANMLALTGGWVEKAKYPRLFYWHVNNLPVDQLGTGTQDVTPNAENKTKWIIGTTKFWIPDYRDSFIRTSGAGRLAGSYQLDQVGQIAITGKIIRKAGTSNNIVALANINDSVVGDHQVIINSGQETRPKNVAANAYVII